MADAAAMRSILNRYTKPDMARNWPAYIARTDVVTHKRTALGKHLINVPVRTLHCAEHAIDEPAVDVLVEQVAHRVDKNHPGLLPLQGLFEPGRPKLQVKALLVGMAWHAAPALGEPLGIAIVAAGTDPGASSNRIPRRIGPFDRGALRHISAPLYLLLNLNFGCL
jgi:hypothetical protein